MTCKSLCLLNFLTISALQDMHVYPSMYGIFCDSLILIRVLLSSDWEKSCFRSLVVLYHGPNLCSFLDLNIYCEIKCVIIVA